MSIVDQFFINFWNITNMIAIYIILGIAAASFLKKYIKDSFIQKQLGSNNKATIFKASFLGIPLPLCSCSVVPFALSLKKSGANKAALSSFLVSTPVIGIDSILASYGAFGWFFAVYRVITSFITATVAGFVSYYFENNEKQLYKEAETSSSCCQSSGCCSTKEQKKPGFLDYAYNQLFKDIAKPLFYGLILAALLLSLLPKELDIFLTNNLLLSYLLILLISVPLYICATSSIPLGVALIVAGFSPGTAFLLLSAGPATSFVSIMVVKKILGLKGMVLYLCSIIFTSLLFAFIFDSFFASLIDFTYITQGLEEFSLLSNLFAVVFLGMILFSFKPKKSCCGG